MSIRKRQTKHGTSYDVCIYVAPGKRRAKTVRTKSAAIALEAAWIAERDAKSTHDGTLTLKQYITRVYWPVASQRLAATSKDTYEQEIRLRINPALGALPLRDIDRAAIQNLMVDKCASAGTAKKSIGVLKTILNEAIHDGYITKNYACSKFALPSTPSQPRDNGLVLSTFAEIHAALDMVDEYATTSVQRIAYTGLLQGLRPEERYALDWSCFDLDAQTLTITQARIKASPLHGGVQDKTTKTANSKRTIPIHPRLHALLLSTPSTRSGAFIQAATGGRISPSTAQHRWRQFLREHPDFPPVTIENMRHSFATAYLDAGGHIETLSRILGHANISTTVNRYFRPDVKALRNDFDRITQESRMDNVCAGQRLEFDSPRLHHFEQSLLQVIAEYFGDSE